MTVWRGGSCPSSTTKMIFPRCTNATQHSDLVYIFSNSEEEFSLLTTSCFFILIENSLRKFPNLSRERFVKSFFISCTFSTVTFLTIFFKFSFKCLHFIMDYLSSLVPLIMLSTLREILSKTDVVTNYVKRGKLFSHTSKLLEIYWFWC